MRNPLQEQLLKAGLAKKSRLDQVAREQAKQRHAKSAPAANTEQAEAERVRLEKVERDRALSAERNAQAKAQELRAQVRQIVEQNRLKPEGEIDYRFTHGGVIRSLPVSDAVRRQLANGSLVIVCHDDGYAIVPRAAVRRTPPSGRRSRPVTGVCSTIRTPRRSQASARPHARRAGSTIAVVRSRWAAR